MVSEVQGSEIAVLLTPTTVTLVSAREESGTDCIATIAWAMPISHDPSMMVVAIRPNGRTARAMERGSFVINVLPASEDGERVALACGKKGETQDRLDKAKISLAPAAHVPCARVEQAVSWIECELVSHEPCGDHELIIGRTVCAETRGTVDDDGKLEPEPALLMSQRGSFGGFRAFS